MARGDRWKFGNGSYRARHLAKRRRHWPVVAMLSALLLFAATAALADNTVVDGDLIVTGSHQSLEPLDLGTICVDESEDGDAEVRARRQGSGTGTWDNSSLLTAATVGAPSITASSPSDATIDVAVPGLPATDPAAGNSDGNRIRLPSNWHNLSNNALSAPVTVNVQVDAGEETGSFEATVAFSLSGDGQIGGQTFGTLTHTGHLTVLAEISDEGDCELAGNTPPEITKAEFDPATVSCGTSAALKVEFDDPDLGDTHTADIDWGDGNETLGISVSPSVEFQETHLYGAAGVYEATVTVTDYEGDFDTATAQIQVNFTIVGGGFQSPLTGTQNATPPIFNAKSTIPTKVIVQDCDGSYPDTLEPEIVVRKVSGSPPTEGTPETTDNTNQPDSGGIMRFSDNQYMYNLAAKSLPDSTATYRIRVLIELPNFTGNGGPFDQVIGPTEFGLKGK